MSELAPAGATGGDAYREFLRAPSMSAGLYTLPAGATDLQKPHAEDELYYVVEGHGALRLEDEDVPVGPGSLVFVGARKRHHFHTIAETLRVLVVFSPPERAERPV